MRGGCLLAVGARRARGSNKFSSVRLSLALRDPILSPWPILFKGHERALSDYATLRRNAKLSLFSCRTPVGRHGDGRLAQLLLMADE